MSNIHHAVAKKAAANQVTFEYADGVFTATHLPSNSTATAATATEALARVLKGAAPEKPAKAPRAKKASQPKAKKAGKRKAKKRASDEDGEEGEEGEEEGGGSKSVVKAKYKKLYRPNKDTNGDDFAQALHEAVCPDGEGVDIGAFTKVCRDNSIDAERIRKWTRLKNKQGEPNTGMMRMNLGNVLRGMIRRSELVKLGTKSFKGSMASLKPLPTKAKAD